MACGPVVHRGEAWLKKGVLCSKQRCPSSLIEATWSRVRRTVMDRVVIGIDPHKRSVTIAARDTREVLRAVGTFGSRCRGMAGAAAGLSGSAARPVFRSPNPGSCR
jgi:hypothetical protein